MFAEFEVTREDDRAVVAVRGELDLASVDQMRSALASALAECPAEVVVDLSGATFVDSSGLGVIVGAEGRRDASGAGQRRVVVRGASHAVRRVFEVAGLESLLERSPES